MTTLVASRTLLEASRQADKWPEDGVGRVILEGEHRHEPIGAAPHKRVGLRRSVGTSPRPPATRRARASVSEKLKAWPPPSRDALFTHRDTRLRSLTTLT